MQPSLTSFFFRIRFLAIRNALSRKKSLEGGLLVTLGVASYSLLGAIDAIPVVA